MKPTTFLASCLAILSLSAASAHADVVHNLSLDFQSGAQYVGTVTFKDDYSSLLDTNGTLTGGSYGSISFGWTWYQGAGPIDSQNEDFLPNTLEDYLMQGPDINASDFNQIGISWLMPVVSGAPQLAITGATNRTNRSINTFDAITEYSFGQGSFVQGNTVPEPGGLALAGLALAAAAFARRRNVG